MYIYSHLLVIVDLLLITWLNLFNLFNLLDFILLCICTSDESNVIVDVCVLRKMQTYIIIHT